MKADINDSPPFHPPAAYDIDLVGFLDAGLGLGETARAIHKTLVLAGFKVRTIKRQLSDCAALGYETTVDSNDLGEDYVPAPFCICSINGEHMNFLARKTGGDFFQNRKIIGVWFWETPCLPPAASEGFPYVDEIWTCSEFTAEAIRRAAPDAVPVIKTFPHPVAKSAQLNGSGPFSKITKLDLGERFLFLFSMDFKSCVMRKNPHGVCEAFVTAFPEQLENGPVCLIKSINADKCCVASFELRRAYAHRKDILFLDGFLPTTERDLLHSRADCYVSLHRAEGLGLTLLESMAAGKPCIATAYSGNLSFMNEGNSFLIPYREVEVGPGSIQYPATDIWAEPDIDEAARAMLECFRGSDRVVSRARAGQAHVLANHSFAAAADAIASLVEDSRSMPHRVKKLPEAEDFMALVRERLDRLRQLEKDIESKRRKGGVFRRPNELALLKKAVLDGRKGIEFTLKALRKERKRANEQSARLEDMINVLRHDLQSLVAIQRAALQNNEDVPASAPDREPDQNR